MSPSGYLKLRLEFQDHMDQGFAGKRGMQGAEHLHRLEAVSSVHGQGSYSPFSV